MDIGQISTNLSMINLQNNVGVAMLSKQMDTAEELGQGMVNMIDSAAMERSVNPHIGQNIDLLI